MKKRCLFLASVLLLLCACGANAAPSQPAPDDKAELIVFAASSMTETLEEIAGLYATEAPNVSLTYNFDSSGTLLTQIQEGAECDLFISAGQKQMDDLGDGAVLETRVDLLENKVTLCVPGGNPAGVIDFADLADKLRNSDILFAMGNSDIPAGQYTQKIFAYYGLDEAALASAGKITYGGNVKEVTAQIKEGSVSCGVVYCTDAFSAGLEVIEYATPEMCGQIIYPAAVINGSTNPDAAKAFLNYLQTPESMAVFEKVGFAPV